MMPGNVISLHKSRSKYSLKGLARSVHLIREKYTGAFSGPEDSLFLNNFWISSVLG